MAFEFGQSLLHYRLIAQIGEGGMGVVWKAKDTTLDLEVAIKILPAGFAGDPERLARFTRPDPHQERSEGVQQDSGRSKRGTRRIDEAETEVGSTG